MKLFLHIAFCFLIFLQLSTFLAFSAVAQSTPNEIIGRWVVVRDPTVNSSELAIMTKPISSSVDALDTTVGFFCSNGVVFAALHPDPSLDLQQEKLLLTLFSNEDWRSLGKFRFFPLEDGFYFVDADKTSEILKEMKSNEIVIMIIPIDHAKLASFTIDTNGIQKAAALVTKECD